MNLCVLATATLSFFSLPVSHSYNKIAIAARLASSCRVYETQIVRSVETFRLALRRRVALKEVPERQRSDLEVLQMAQKVSARTTLM